MGFYFDVFQCRVVNIRGFLLHSPHKSETPPKKGNTPDGGEFL